MLWAFPAGTSLAFENDTTTVQTEVKTVDKIVEKVVYVDKVVHVDKVVYVDKVVEKLVEKEVEVVFVKQPTMPCPACENSMWSAKQEPYRLTCDHFVCVKCFTGTEEHPILQCPMCERAVDVKKVEADHARRQNEKTERTERK